MSGAVMVRREGMLMEDGVRTWLDYLAERRQRRFVSDHPAPAEYVPVVSVTRPDGSRIPIVSDEVTIDDREAPQVRSLVQQATELTHDELDRGRMRFRHEGSGSLYEQVAAPHVTPTYVGVVGGRIKNRPTPEPAEREREPEPASATGDAVADDATLVIVIDTGLAAAVVGRDTENRTDGWLGRCELADDSDVNIDRLDVLEPEGLDLGAGHGTFVAGLIGRVTPARIMMLRAFDTDGLASDIAIADAIRRAADIFARESGGSGVLNLSCGVETLNNDEPEVLRAALEALPSEVVVVAAAGNDPSAVPFWPAASKRAIGVGALDDELRPTEWSNHGVWVDFSARGTDLVGPFVAGTETQGSGEPGDPFDIEPDHYDGPNPFAVWEGTSFAAAQVSGMVANLLRSTPEMTRAQVADRLRSAAAGAHLPGYGYPLSVLPDS